MKIERHGRAEILSQSEIQLLFSQGLQTPRDRALFGICLIPDLTIRGKYRVRVTRGKVALKALLEKHFRLQFLAIGLCLVGLKLGKAVTRYEPKSHGLSLVTGILQTAVLGKVVLLCPS